MYNRTCIVSSFFGFQPSNLIRSPPITPMPIATPDIPHRPAASLVFSNGLPLLLNLCVDRAVAVDDAACGCCDVTGGGAVTSGVELVDATADVEEELESLDALVCLSRVVVKGLPELSVLGPMTIGISISSVLPSLSLEVWVKVVV